MEAARSSFFSFFFSWSIGGNSKRGDPSWHQSWHISSERLWSMDPGIRHPGTTLAPGSQGEGTITVVMVLVAEV